MRLPNADGGGGAMGGSPSFSTTGQINGALTLDHIALSLRSLAPTIELSLDKISSIERRIFSTLEMNMKPEQAPAIDLSSAEDTTMQDIAAEIDSIFAESDVASWQDLPVVEAEAAPAPARRSLRLPRVRVNKWIAGLMAIFTAFIAVTYTAEKATAGTAMFPVKVAIESARLRFAGTPLRQASIYMSITADRLRNLGSIETSDTKNLNLVLNQMDAAGLGAVRSLRASADGPLKTELATSLYGLAMQEQIILESLVQNAPPSAIPAITRSFRNAVNIAWEATGWMPQGTASISNAPVFPGTLGSQIQAPTPPPAPGQVRPRAKNQGPVQGGTSNNNTQNPAPPQGGDGNNGGEDGFGGCDLPDGMICITVPEPKLPALP